MPFLFWKALTGLLLYDVFGFGLPRNSVDCIHLSGIVMLPLGCASRCNRASLQGNELRVCLLLQACPVFATFDSYDLAVARCRGGRSNGGGAQQMPFRLTHGSKSMAAS